MKVAIIGSRSVTALNIGEYLPACTTTIVSGGSRGVDSLAAEYARAHGIELIEFLPDYKRYGRGAPLQRNALIVEACDIVLAFWDGVSRGTKYTINLAKQAGKEVIIHIV